MSFDAVNHCAMPVNIKSPAKYSWVLKYCLGCSPNYFPVKFNKFGSLFCNHVSESEITAFDNYCT